VPGSNNSANQMTFDEVINPGYTNGMPLISTLNFFKSII